MLLVCGYASAHYFFFAVKFSGRFSDSTDCLLSSPKAQSSAWWDSWRGMRLLHMCKLAICICWLGPVFLNWELLVWPQPEFFLSFQGTAAFSVTFCPYSSTCSEAQHSHSLKDVLLFSFSLQYTIWQSTGAPDVLFRPACSIQSSSESSTVFAFTKLECRVDNPLELQVGFFFFFPCWKW